MPSFSKLSADRLATCDPRIQEVLNEAIKHIDFTILCGTRGQQAQEQAFHDGKSKEHWPNSKHNKVPSLAVDIAPWPVNWQNLSRFRITCAFILGIAAAKGIKMRWGGDWNMNYDDSDEKFVDAGHLELME